MYHASNDRLSYIANGFIEPIRLQIFLCKGPFRKQTSFTKTLLSHCLVKSSSHWILGRRAIAYKGGTKR